MVLNPNTTVFKYRKQRKGANTPNWEAGTSKYLSCLCSRLLQLLHNCQHYCDEAFLIAFLLELASNWGLVHMYTGIFGNKNISPPRLIL